MRKTMSVLVTLCVVVSIQSASAATRTRGATQVSVSPSVLDNAGLRGEYYSDAHFAHLVTARVDPSIDFDWRKKSAAPGIPNKGYSIRWLGQIQPSGDGAYRPVANTSGWVRVWVGTRLALDQRQGKVIASHAVKLAADRRSELTVLYVDEGPSGRIALRWHRDNGAGAAPSLYPPAVWSDPTTWATGAPQAGTPVAIPEGSMVVLDQSPPRLKSIQVDGTLVVEDVDLSLDVGEIAVTGRMEIGSRAVPFRHHLTITLTGYPSDTAEETEGAFPKGVSVMGRLDLYGRLPQPTWTRLARTAPLGAMRLVLERHVDWRPGDEIVVASTDFIPGHAEVATVRSVHGRVIGLDHALSYTHWGREQNFRGKKLAEKAEVGLLTRDVLIQGDPASTQDGIGGHLMVHDSGVAHIVGTEFYRMGQEGHLGRYPIHFHLDGWARTSVVKGNSIYDSYNRCVTVHGTHGLLVENNVAYNDLGHCYFLEDGIETHNRFIHNLGVLTRTPPAGKELSPSDNTPATFWITNPDNVWRGNVAAGSDSYGFWFDPPKHPTGPSATDKVFPRKLRLGSFTGNVAHSNIGAKIDPARDTSDAFILANLPSTGFGVRANQYSPWHRAEYSHVLVYKNAVGGFWLGRHQRVDRSLIADNLWGVRGTGAVDNSTLIGLSRNGTMRVRGLTDEAVLGLALGNSRITSSHDLFVNFNISKVRAAAIGWITVGPSDPRSYVEHARFLNAFPAWMPAFGYWDPTNPSSLLVRSRDRSIGGVHDYLVAGNPLLVAPRCKQRTLGWECPYRYGVLRFASSAISPTSHFAITRESGSRNFNPFESGQPFGEVTGAAFNPILGMTYKMRHRGGTPAAFNIRLSAVRRGDWTEIVVPYPFARVTARNGKAPLPRFKSFEAFENSHTAAYFYDRRRRVLRLKLVVSNPARGITVHVARNH